MYSKITKLEDLYLLSTIYMVNVNKKQKTLVYFDNVLLYYFMLVFCILKILLKETLTAIYIFSKTRILQKQRFGSL